MAIQTNLSFARNMPATHVFTYRDSADALVNLTGYTCTLRTCPANNPDSVTTTTTPDANITLGGAAGTVTIAWSGLLSGLSELSAFELHLTNGTTNIELVSGTLFIRQTT